MTALDNHNMNGRELFAETSFCLVAQTTQDGAALAREKEAQRLAKEAAEQAQGHLFPVTRKPATYRSGYCSLSALAAMPFWVSLNPPQRLALREYLKAVEKSEKMARKAADDFGMGRRRSTTNAANWSTYAGQRDRLEKTLIETGVPLSRIIEIEAEWRKIRTTA